MELSMDMYNKEQIKEYYDRILEQNKEVILKGGTGDPYLLAPDTDTRMALALIIQIHPSINKVIDRYMNEMKAIEPDLYYYPDTDRHITVMDILRGMPGRTVPENIKDYIACIQECAYNINPFDFVFDGFTMSDNAVMIRGYYEYPLEHFRQQLRSELKKRALPLEERYQTFSGHITIARIPDRLTHPEQFFDYIQNRKFIGRMQAVIMRLMFHNWYDSKKKELMPILMNGRPMKGGYR